MKRIAHEKTYLFLKGYYFIRFIGDAFLYSLLYVYLSHIGLTSDKIGLISALAPFLALLGNILFQKLATNLDVNRRLMIVMGFLEAFFAILFVILRTNELFFILMIIGGISLLNTPFYSLLDGYSGTYIEQEKKQFSSMRIMGTIAYLFSTLAAGFIVKLFSYEVLFALAGFFFFMTAILTFYLPHQNVTKNEKPLPPRTRIKINKNLTIYFIFNFLIFAPALVTDNFFGVYLSNVFSIESQVIGIITACALLVETLTFIFIIYKKNMFRNSAFALGFMGLTLGIRPVLIAFAAPQLVLIILSTLRGLALGYYLVFNVRYLSRIVPLKDLTKALFTVSIFLTVGRILWSLLLGYGIHNFGYQPTYIVTVAFFFIALTIIVTYSSIINSEKYINNKKTLSI